MRVLSDEACRTAALRAQACGRTKVVGIDMVLALKYEAHEFFEKNIEGRFLEYLEDERRGESWIAQFMPQDNYETDEENNDNENEDSGDETESYESESEDDELANHSLLENATNDQRKLYEKMEKYDREWNDWNPEDPAQQLIKRSINSINERMGIELK
jgi:hypothetical protein